MSPLNKLFYIYALWDARTPDAIRYIGYTRDAASRLYEHRYHSLTFKNNTHKANWIRKVYAEGAVVCLTVLETCDGINAAKRREIALIKLYKLNGHDLTNHTLGGDGTIGFKFSIEQRAAVSSRLKGNTNMLGHKHSESTRRLLSQRHTGRKDSPELVERRARSLRGQKRTPDQRQHMKDAWVIRKQLKQYGTDFSHA